MNRVLLLVLLGLAGCAANASASASATAVVPVTVHERSVTHEEHVSQSCSSASQCEAPLTCCFSAPDGTKLTAGYCASAEMCEAVSAPAP